MSAADAPAYPAHRLPLETPWTAALEAGLHPSPEALRAHLIAVHRHNAGFTERVAKRCRDATGRNSYAWLADAVDPARHASVLDLACGSGALLELCQSRWGDRVALSGVDMSGEELALARRRLGPGAALHHGLAQDLAMLARGTMDAVLCHWALTLMDPVQPVLSEVARVLAPGGVFAAIIDGEISRAPGYETVHDIIYGHVQRAHPRYGEIEMGDPAVRTTASLTALARDAFPGASVVVEPGVFAMEGAPQELAREATGFFYAAFTLSGAAYEALIDDLADHFATSLRYAMPVNRLLVRF